MKNTHSEQLMFWCCDRKQSCLWKMAAGELVASYSRTVDRTQSRELLPGFVAEKIYFELIFIIHQKPKVVSKDLY